MAKLVGVFNTAHSPFCYMAPERWNEVRANRSLREDVPLDTPEENAKKGERIQKGFENAAQMGELPVLITSPSIRPHVRAIIERFRPQTVVMSQNEVHPRVRLKTIGSV